MSSAGGQWLFSARSSRFFFASSVVVLAVGFLTVILHRPRPVFAVDLLFFVVFRPQRRLAGTEPKSESSGWFG